MATFLQVANPVPAALFQGDRDRFRLNRLMNITPATSARLLAVLLLSLAINLLVVPSSSGAVPAFLPSLDAVPPSQPTAIDGDWRISTIGKRIRIDSGRAYAIDDWLHAFVLHIQPGMVVIKDIRRDDHGGFIGEDLPLLGKWSARPAADGSLDVQVTGALGPVSYRLLSVQSEYPNPGPITPQPAPLPSPPPVTAPPPVSPPIAAPIAESLSELGKNCIRDFKPMAGPMLKYYACQKALGKFNALKRAIKAKNVEDAKGIVTAAACHDELQALRSTLRTKGFQSISLGVSGEVSIGVGGTGEYAVAMNLEDLSDPTLYATVGAGLGIQLGGSVSGVVSAHYKRADNLAGGGKSFAVSLKVAGGGGAAVGISNGRSPSCESFSATAGVGGLANAGSLSSTYTAKLIKFPSPDFTAACKDVTVKASNRSGREIKIIDVDFYDYVNSRWRSKAVKNTKVADGRSWTKNLRLQKVGGDRTRVRIQYRKRDGHSLLNPWSKVINRETGAKVCRSGTQFSAVLR